MSHASSCTKPQTHAPAKIAAAAPTGLPANDNRVIAGIAIDVDTHSDSPVFFIQLLGPGLLPVETLATTGDETAARRLWRLMARSLRRPCFVANPQGGFKAVERLTGALVGREPIARRGRRVPLRRRHLSRRQIAANAVRRLG